MKKVLAIIVALGIILGGGVKFNVAAGSGDYYDIPSEPLPIQRG